MIKHCGFYSDNLRKGMNHAEDGDSKPNDGLAFIETQNGDREVKTGNTNIHLENLTCNGRKRKLIIHFDIRNTVLVSDLVTNVTVEQALNSFLAGVAWGKQGKNGSWHWHSYTPSLLPPAPDTITFYKFLESRLVNTTTDRVNLRIATGDFTQQEYGSGFLPYFKDYMNKLKWQYPFSPEHENLTMASQDKKPCHYVLPSVYKFIHHLVDTKRDFAIVFRSYGLDTANVIDSLGHGMKGNHPGFPKPLSIKHDSHTGNIHRSEDQPIVFESFLSKRDGEQFIGDRAIYKMLSKLEGMCGFKDDFLFWQGNKYHHRAGKPMYIDPYDYKVQHILFDDNIRTYMHDSIVDLRLFENQDATEARSLSNTESANFENSVLFQADLLKAIDDEDYFVKGLKLCEENYSNFLESFHGKS